MRAKQFITEAQMTKQAFKHLMTPAVKTLRDVVEASGFEIRIVGGAVRDLVSGKDPKDIDMASTATPDEMTAMLDKAGIQWIPTGLQHGTITAVLDHEPIEITTLRVDTNQDGRWADVEFTTDWKADAERRDLTFNAMSMDLDGNLYDYYNGVEDLNNGVARFVGDATQRIQEDFLRILRYFRFQARISNPKWDMATLERIRDNAPGLREISRERIGNELLKIFGGKNLTKVIKKMRETGVADAIHLPTDRLDELARVEAITDDKDLRLAALIPDVDSVKKIREALRLKNVERFKIEFVIRNRDTDFDLATAKVALTDPKLKYPELVLKVLEYQNKPQLVSALQNWTVPQMPVSGADLQAAGVAQGPMVGRAMSQLRQAWQDSGFVLSKEELLNLV